MKPALFVIDMQKDYFNRSERMAESMKSAVEYINAAIEVFRKKNLPVIVVQHMNQEDGPMPGQSGFEVLDELKLQPQDGRVTKTYGNAFTKTGLAEKLRELGIDTIILTGLSAESCVLSTYRGALDFDFKPIMLRGSLASSNAENIKFVEQISETITYGALNAFI